MTSKECVIDIETTRKHDKIWMCGLYDIDTEDYVTATAPDVLDYRLASAVVGHNIIGFDAPKLKGLWGVDIDHSRLRDTLVMWRLLDPSRGSHALAEYGKKIGDEKGDFKDFDGPAEGETELEWRVRMEKYCKQDILLTAHLYKRLCKRLKDHGFSDECIELEHDVYRVVKKQEDNGMYFDIDAAYALYAKLGKRYEQLKHDLQEIFPPIITERWSEKTGKRLKDNVEEFNPGSRDQIAKRLTRLGVTFTELTDTGKAKVSEEVLEGLLAGIGEDTVEDYVKKESVESILEYLMLQKRQSQMENWFNAYNQDTHRLHGRVNPNGAVTGRMTHFSPNLAQVPSVHVPYGKECRDLFTVPEGRVLVGADASGLEARMLAHEMGDPEYIDLILHGDVHQHNADILGISRQDAKTFLYALIYGAGSAKLGSITGTSGAKAKKRFFQGLPKYQEMYDRITAEALSGSIAGLDGRRIWCPHDKTYTAINRKLQANGAIVMKQALVIAAEAIEEVAPSALLVVQAHDEWQWECSPEEAELVGEICVDSIKQAGVYYELNIPLDGEYKVGQTWADTH